MLKGDCNNCLHGNEPEDSEVCIECGIVRKNYEEKIMTEYISREALPEKRERGFIPDDDFNAGWNACLNAIASTPAADVAPVIHAHWEIKYKWEPLAWDTDPLDWDRYDEKTHSEEVDYYACSKCGYDGGSWKPNWKYCPHCGATMDESEESK